MMKSIANHIRRSVARRGIAGTLTFVPLASIRKSLDFLASLSPAVQRRRQREARFDEKLGIDTRGTIDLAELEIESPNSIFGNRFQATPQPVFRELIGSIPESPDGFTFIDLGSGKGRTLIMATEFPFAKIMGVEFSPELHEAAQRNLSSYKAPWRRRCNDVRTVCHDAARFEFPDSPLIAYFYNPFERPVMTRVIQRLEESIRNSPRTVYIVYYEPQNADLLDASTCFHQHACGPDWVIYSTKPTPDCEPSLTTERPQTVSPQDR